MYSRVVRLQGEASRADEAIHSFADKILPLIKKQPGFAGVSLLVDRKTGSALSVSYWDTEQAMQTSRGQIRPHAEPVTQASGSRVVEEDEFEVGVLERFQQPKANVWARVTTVQADPSNVDQGIADYKAQVVPAVQRQPGVRTAVLLVNRKTGKSLSGTVWTTEKDLQASEAAVTGLRKQISERLGDKSPKVEIFEIVVTEILATAAARR